MHDLFVIIDKRCLIDPKETAEISGAFRGGEAPTLLPFSDGGARDVNRLGQVGLG